MIAHDTRAVETVKTQMSKVPTRIAFVFFCFTTALCSESDGGGVNLKRIDAYAVLGWENDTKFHVFAIKHKVNTQNEQSAHSDNCVLF
jgi:hypothetical protein